MDEYEGDTSDEEIDPEELQTPQQKIFDARKKTVNLVFERAGVPVKVHREIEIGGEDNYGKDEEAMFTVADDVLAIMYYPGSSPGGQRPDRVEERFGEHVYWEPLIYFRHDAPVLEKDIIEYPMPRYPMNPNADRQLWELETIVPMATHVEGQLQRFIEQ